jgi:hypothetical protein
MREQRERISERWRVREKATNGVGVVVCSRREWQRRKNREREGGERERSVRR